MAKKTTKEKIDDYMLNHSRLKIAWEWIYDIFMSIVSAFIFAFGFRSFIAPSNDAKLASGGASGLSQILVKAIELIRGSALEPVVSNNIISIAYIVINIPIILLAFFGIGKRFAVLTVANVLFVSLFNSIIPESFVEIFMLESTAYLPRALFAGICTGMSSAIAFHIGASAGGMDVISYFFSIKKSVSIGKIVFGINGTIIVIFSLLSYIQEKDTADILLYTLVYVFTTSLIIDKMERNNKKVQIQIVSQKDDLPSILISAFPHGCTVINATGGYSGEPVKMIIIDVSFDECGKVIKLARELDEKVFIDVVPLSSVHGKFFIKPIR